MWQLIIYATYYRRYCAITSYMFINMQNIVRVFKCNIH